jgi:hypothetical protein
MTRAQIGLNAIGMGLLAAGLLASPALAQKIAPSRLYDGPADKGPAEYTPAARSAPDKNYGLPTFGRPEANMPQQRTLATPQQSPDQTPEFQTPEPVPIAPGPAVNGPNAAVAPFVPQERPDAMPDVFARDGADEPLPSEKNRGAAGSTTMDTPMFTTSTSTDLMTSSAQRATQMADPAMTTTRGSTLDPVLPDQPGGPPAGGRAR